MDIRYLVNGVWQQSSLDPHGITGPPPKVLSIVRNNSNPTSLQSVRWTVKFDSSVANVGLGDFVLVQASGVTGASLTSVTDSGDHITYTVVANTGSGDGTLGLNLVDDDSIVNLFSIQLGGPGVGNGNFTGQVFTVSKTVSTFKTIYGMSTHKPSNLSVATKSLSGNVATLTMTANVPANVTTFGVGSPITVTGVDATFNGNFTITAVGAKTISYAKTAANVGSTASTGKVQYYDHSMDTYIALGSGDLAMFNYLQTEYGGLSSTTNPLAMRHVYPGNMPTNYSNPTSGTPAGIHVMIATKGADGTMNSGGYDTNLASIASTAPSTTKTWVTYNHEPERSRTGTQITTYLDAFAHFCKVLLDNRGSNQVYPTLCLQQYTWQTSSGKTPSDWNPASALKNAGVNLDDVVFGIDVYTQNDLSFTNSGSPNGQQYKDRVTKPFNDILSWGFTRLATPELGCDNFPTSGSPSERLGFAAWMDDVAATNAKYKVEVASYFQSDIGNNVGINGWYIFSDANKIKFAQIADTGGPA